MGSREVWSLSFGRWKGVHLQLHMFFLLFAVFSFYLVWIENVNRNRPINDDLAIISLATVAILFFSVLVHEIGHCVVARRLGGHVDSIVLGPLGGMHPIRIPHDPQSELLAVVAGPMTSLTLCLVCLTAIAATSESDLAGLLHPFQPSGIFVTTDGILAAPTILRLTCWINWMIVLVNLIPAFPFDGGRACKAFLQSLRPDLEPHHAVLLIGHLARVVALCLLIAAVVFGRDTRPLLWPPLVMLSIFVFFITRVEEMQPAQSNEPDDSVFGYDFSQGYTSLAKSVEGDEANVAETAPSSWLTRWKQHQEDKRQETEAEEDRRLDEILARLHEVGQSGLTPEERLILNRVSARYRSREES